ncbi:Carboxylesterase NlhH [compost metagenome]
MRDHSLPSGHGALRVREYRSGAQGNTPAILFLHGGGWVIGNLETHDGLCRLLAKESQATVFAVDYRLAPEHPFPTSLDDCVAALQWLSSNADALGVDMARLGLAGDSAGGNLAAVLANEDRLRPEGCSPCAQALFYPVTDLRCETASYRRIVSGFPLTAGSMRWFRDRYVGSAGTFDDPRVSPLLAPRLSRAPLFLLSCGLDPLADEGVAYAARAIEGGIRVEHHHLPAHAHGIMTSAGRIETGRAMALRAARFLGETLRRCTAE